MALGKGAREVPNGDGGQGGDGERADGRTGSWAGMGRDRRPDQMASGIHRGAARPAGERAGNKRGNRQGWVSQREGMQTKQACSWGVRAKRERGKYEKEDGAAPLYMLTFSRVRTVRCGHGASSLLILRSTCISFIINGIGQKSPRIRIHVIFSFGRQIRLLHWKEKESGVV